MVILDINVMVYFFRQESIHHENARAFIKKIDDDDEQIGWHTSLLASYIRVVTNSTAFVSPTTLDQALLDAKILTGISRAIRISESERFWRIFTDLLTKYKVTGPAVSDFYWAALAIDHGATLCSAYKKFGQIKELKWHNLLASC